MHVDDASRCSVEQIKKGLTQMEASIKNLEMDLKNASRNPTEKDDKFSDSMGAFCADARYQCDILKAMAQKMDGLYDDLAEYFVFDKTKYNLEEFMSDIKTFKVQFKVKLSILFKNSVKLVSIISFSRVFLCIITGSLWCHNQGKRSSRKTKKSARSTRETRSRACSARGQQKSSCRFQWSW